MATDATGTPTSPDSLAKLSSSDAPRITSSGGINAVVDTIQTALNNKLKITGSPTSNQVPVWNGSAWVPQILGSSNITTGSLSLTTFSANSSGADQTMSTSPVDVTGCSITSGTAATYAAFMNSTLINSTVIGWGGVFFALIVNGVTQSGNLVWNDPGVTGTSPTLARAWVFTTGGASQTVKLQASKSAGGGTVALTSGNTSLLVVKLTAP